ncbi:MAG: hypothetical protein ABI035_14645 [Gemmatimonadaceae bacterium]
MTHIFTITRHTFLGAALLFAEFGAREPRSVNVAMDASVPASVSASVSASKFENKSTCSVPLRSGRWRTPGGNYFWIQCTGSEIFWLGMSRASGDRSQGTMWTQVGHGMVQGADIKLSWSDVPYGSIRTEGRIELKVDADTVLQVIRDDGPCDLSKITWVSAK